MFRIKFGNNIKIHCFLYVCLENFSPYRSFISYQNKDCLSCELQVVIDYSSLQKIYEINAVKI